MKKLFIGILFLCSVFAAFGQGTVFTGSSTAIGDTVEMRLRAIVPTTVEVDWGDGARVSFEVDSAIAVITGCIAGDGEIAVYGNAGDLWVFTMYNAGLTSVDVSALVNVVCFGFGGNALPSIDLSNNLKVAELTLGENPMTKVDVSMLPELRYLVLANMPELEGVDVSRNPKLENLYVMGTPLDTLDVSQNPELWDLQCMGCGLDNLDLSHNPKMVQLMCENNNLVRLDVSACPNLRYLRCYNNYLTIGTLPLFHPMETTSYQYAPQKPLPMPDTVGGIDFSAGYDCEGYISQYTWRTEDGRTLINGLDYTMTDGIINFLTPGLTVSGQIENSFFPSLTGEYACQTEFFVTDIGHVGNENTQLGGTKVWQNGGMICMESLQQAKVGIYGANGMLLHSFTLNGTAEWEVPSTGIYVVRMQAASASAVHKIMVLK